MLEDFQRKIEQHFEQKFEVYMTHFGEKMSEILVEKQPQFYQDEPSTHMHKEVETPHYSSTHFVKVSKDSEVTQLLRKQKFIGTTIEVICEEICKLNNEKTARTEMESTLKRLKSWELEYSNVVQTIVSNLVEESLVNDEIQKWAQFQQKILQISSVAEKYIFSQVNIEETEKRNITLTNIEQSSVASNILLPKFTLPEFMGNIWVSWWDQFKTCIHENEMLSNRDRFNYLRMYVTGTARRAIEYIEVSNKNYTKAIDALQRRFGRKRLVVEHLIELLLQLEKKEKIDATSLRNLYVPW
jgi:prefoldin subunit 5